MGLFSKKEELPFPKKKNKFDELFKSNQKDKDALVIEVVNNCINISGKSITEDDRQEWVNFLNTLNSLVQELKIITINLKVDLFNSSQGQYSTRMMKTLNDNRHRCKAVVNFYYLKDDEMYGHGLILKELYPNTEFNLVEYE